MYSTLIRLSMAPLGRKRTMSLATKPKVAMSLRIRSGCVAWPSTCSAPAPLALAEVPVIVSARRMAPSIVFAGDEVEEPRRAALWVR